MKKLFLFLTITALSFSGCGSSVKSVKKVQTNEVIKPQNFKPKWIDNPDLEGYYGAVGIVKLMQNKKKQVYIAKKLAIASLQERQRVEINSQIELSSQGDNDDDASSITKQTSSHFNSYDIIQKDEFSDNENYYIWMVVKK